MHRLMPSFLASVATSLPDAAILRGSLVICSSPQRGAGASDKWTPRDVCVVASSPLAWILVVLPYKRLFGIYFLYDV